MRSVALAALLLITVSALSWADDVPDPCKLVSESDISKILGLGSVEIQQDPAAPPVASFRVVDRGAGNIGLAMPVNSGPRKNTLVCGARAGSVRLAIEVTSAEQEKVDEADGHEQLQLLERNGYKVEETTYGAISCQEILKPTSDMLGRKPELNNLVVANARCHLSSDGWQVAIAAFPWTPKKEPPVSIDKLRALTDLAAQHLSGAPPNRRSEDYHD
jgi:hypothetical protein